MNPLQLWRIYRKANRVATLFQEAAVSKSLFTSKMFWVNTLTASADLLGILPLPPGYSTVALGVINVVLRTLTTQPVHVLPRAPRWDR